MLAIGHPSFTMFGCGSAMTDVCADACHRSSIHRHRRPTVVAFAFRRSGCACTLAASFGGKASVLHPSFTSFGRGSAMPVVCANACHRSSIHRRLTPAQPKVFCCIRRRQPFRSVPPRNGSRLACADQLLLPGDGIGSLHLRLQAFTLRYATVHFFRLRFRSPMPGERGTEKRRRNLSEPFPQAPSRHNKREREQVACAGVTANSSSSSRCSLRSRLSLSVSALQITTQNGTSPPKISATLRRRQPPRRIPPRFGSRLEAANRLSLPGKQPPNPTSGTVAAGERSTRCFLWSGLWPGWLRRRAGNGAVPHQSPASQPTHPMNFSLCIVVRYASTARFAARPSGST